MSKFFSKVFGTFAAFAFATIVGLGITTLSTPASACGGNACYDQGNGGGGNYTPNYSQPDFSALGSAGSSGWGKTKAYGPNATTYAEEEGGSSAIVDIVGGSSGCENNCAAWQGTIAAQAFKRQYTSGHAGGPGNFAGTHGSTSASAFAGGKFVRPE